MATPDEFAANYMVLCNLFEQFSIDPTVPPTGDLVPLTSPQARAYANAVLEVLGVPFPDEADDGPTGKPLLIIGDPVAGFHFFGPYDSPESAIEDATQNIAASWWVGELYPAPHQDPAELAEELANEEVGFHRRMAMEQIRRERGEI